MNKHAGSPFTEYRKEMGIPEMDHEHSLAADYWLENTQRIYKENFHISGPIMEAFVAGYHACLVDMDNNAELEDRRREGDVDAQIYKKKEPKLKKKPRKKVKKNGKT